MMDEAWMDSVKNLWRLLRLDFYLPLGFWFIHAGEPKVSYFWTVDGRLKRWEGGYIVFPDAVK